MVIKQDALTEEMLCYKPLVYKVCSLRLYNKGFLHDAVQSVFLLYLQCKSDLKNDVNLSSWFYWSSINVCKQLNRNEQKFMDLKSKSSTSLPKRNNDEKPSEIEEEKNLDFYMVEEELSQLPAHKRELLFRYYYDNEPIKKIAIDFNLKEDSVRRQMKRIIEEIKGRLAKRNKVLETAVILSLFSVLKVKSNDTELELNQLSSPFHQELVMKISTKPLNTILLIKKVALVVCFVAAGAMGLYSFVINDAASIEKSMVGELKVKKTYLGNWVLNKSAILKIFETGTFTMEDLENRLPKYTGSVKAKANTLELEGIKFQYYPETDKLVQISKNKNLVWHRQE